MADENEVINDYSEVSEESADQFYNELYLVGQLNNSDQLAGQLSEPNLRLSGVVDAGELNQNSQLTGQLSESLLRLSGIVNNELLHTGVLSNATLRGYSAYEIAVLQGFEGTEAEWLAQLGAEKLQIRNNNGVLEYKYESEVFWTELVNLNNVFNDYEKLINKPRIDGTTLIGNRDLFETYYTHTDVMSNWDIDDLLGF